jgi:hypothetical protein
MEHGEAPAVEANENDKENVAKGGNSTAAAELKRRKRRRRT